LAIAAESHAADAAKTVDTNFDCHVSVSSELKILLW